MIDRPDAKGYDIDSELAAMALVFLHETRLRRLHLRGRQEAKAVVNTREVKPRISLSTGGFCWKCEGSYVDGSWHIQGGSTMLEAYENWCLLARYYER